MAEVVVFSEIALRRKEAEAEVALDLLGGVVGAGRRRLTVGLLVALVAAVLAHQVSFAVRLGREQNRTAGTLVGLEAGVGEEVAAQRRAPGELAGTVRTRDAVGRVRVRAALLWLLVRLLRARAVVGLDRAIFGFFFVARVEKLLQRVSREGSIVDQRRDARQVSAVFFVDLGAVVADMQVGTVDRLGATRRVCTRVFIAVRRALIAESFAVEHVTQSGTRGAGERGGGGLGRGRRELRGREWRRVALAGLGRGGASARRFGEGRVLALDMSLSIAFQSETGRAIRTRKVSFVFEERRRFRSVERHG